MRRLRLRKRRKLGAPGANIRPGATVACGAKTGTVLTVVKGAAWVKLDARRFGKTEWHHLSDLRVVEQDVSPRTTTTP